MAAVLVTIPPGTAQAFDTITPGQREHEKITKALSCAASDKPDLCFEWATLRQLAGGVGFFGAVGMPDNPVQGLGPAAKHCDNADYAEAVQGYPQTKAQAQGNLRDCITLYDRMLDRAVRAAERLVNESGELRRRNVDISNGDIGEFTDDFGFPRTPDRDQPAKCEVLNALGRALHIAEDFWAHSNWADLAAAGPNTAANPIGMNCTDIPDFFRYPTPARYVIPDGLVTGCNENVVSCAGRITRQALAKNAGRIDWRDGSTRQPEGVRSRVPNNFGKAVTGARAQARFTWEQFARGIIRRSGRDRGKAIIRAISRDTPWTWCANVGGDSEFSLDPPRRDRDGHRLLVRVRLRNETTQRLSCESVELDKGVWTDFPDSRIPDHEDGKFMSQASRKYGPSAGRVVYQIGTRDQTVKVRWESHMSNQMSLVGRDAHATCKAPDGFRCDVVRRYELNTAEFEVVLREKLSPDRPQAHLR